MNPKELTESLRRIRGGSLFHFRLSPNQKKPYKAESIPSAIATVIEHLIKNEKKLNLRKIQASDIEKRLMKCPYCHDISVVVKPGDECMTCLNCDKEVCT